MRLQFTGKIRNYGVAGAIIYGDDEGARKVPARSAKGNRSLEVHAGTEAATGESVLAGAARITRCPSRCLNNLIANNIPAYKFPHIKGEQYTVND